MYPYINTKNITRRLEDMSFIFLLRTTFYSLAAFVRKILFFTQSTIKFISSHHRVISSLYHGLRELITSLAMHASLVMSRNTTWLCGVIMVLLTLLLCKYWSLSVLVYVYCIVGNKLVLFLCYNILAHFSNILLETSPHFMVKGI